MNPQDIVIPLGFAAVLLSSMLDRGAAGAWRLDDMDRHDWRRDYSRGRVARTIAFLAVGPSLIILISAGARTIGWWTLLAMPIGIVLCFAAFALMTNGSRERAVRRLDRARTPAGLFAIALAIIALAISPQ